VATKFYVRTFGCRCNQADSAAIRDGLCSKSYSELQTAADADFIVVNTCTVTHRTDQQVRQAIRKLHRENPSARLIVTGCYAERDAPSLAALPGVELVVGTADKELLPELLPETCQHPSAERVVRSPLDPCRSLLVPPMSHLGGKTRPFVKLQDGCDARCAYCIVPLVRGPGRSAQPDQVLSEIHSLVDRGYQEIVLTGVHLGTYGRKMPSETSLVELLADILKIPGLGRLRLSSIEPMRFSRKIIDLAACSPIFAPHFHVPLQSGSNRVLRRMRRPYTAERFLDLMQCIERQIPQAALGTDVLVGFPGETDDDFQLTCDVISRSPVTYLHVFPFSGREGTAAWRMAPHVAPKTIHDRARVLREISQEKNLEFRRRFLGKTLDGITLAKEEDLGESVVLTSNYIHCRTFRHSVPPNRLVSRTGGTSGTGRYVCHHH
jgi:threonylcarbamoyladenosine tRNA methylthiotransferase MtaB